MSRYYNDLLIHSEDSYEDELYHFGVKGMKWGVRKRRPTMGVAPRRYRNKYSRSQRDEAIYTKKTMSRYKAGDRNAITNAQKKRAVGYAAGGLAGIAALHGLAKHTNVGRSIVAKNPELATMAAPALGIAVAAGSARVGKMLAGGDSFKAERKQHSAFKANTAANYGEHYANKAHRYSQKANQASNGISKGIYNRRASAANNYANQNYRMADKYYDKAMRIK